MMEPPPITGTLLRARRLADGAVWLLLVAAAGLLGCQQLFDGDVWWHVRAGQWIWEHRAVPTRDPFTFASADRPWIDLHWLFELILAAAFAAGGVRGLILTAAGVGTAVLLIGLAARDRRWPFGVVAACWLPALVAMSARLVPRPEILSFLAMAVYLAVLLRADERPALAWLLVPVQVLWVNVHGLFVLGPIILGAYLVGHCVDAPRRPAAPPAPLRRWGHLGGAAVGVGLACLASPYGLRGALFPMELFPKLTMWGGPYKALVVELLDLREYIRRQGLPALGGLYTRTECALLWALPLSFLVPAIWRAGRGAAGRPGGSSPVRAVAWLVASGLSAGWILVAAIGLPGPETDARLVRLGGLAPAAPAILGMAGAALLVRSSRRAAALAAIGGLAEAAWVAWLRVQLLGPEPGPLARLAGPNSPALGGAAALLGVAAAGLVLRDGGRGPTFRLLLAAFFGYLALQAIRNIGLFGLAAGFVLAWNLGEWAAELAAEPAADARMGAPAGLAARVVLVGLAGLILATVVSGRFFRATGERRAFGLAADPLAYAHEAARFAGRPGLPERALVFDLRQAGVYLFHNGPARKLFMDGRLEVPGRATFETYVRLGHLLIEGRPGWAEPVHRMGDPVILLDHEENSGAEATLLVSPDWRCIYYDAVASVFVARRRRDLGPSFPSVDFAARHFLDLDPSRGAAGPAGPRRFGEAKALFALGSAVGSRAAGTWALRASLLLLAVDRLEPARASGPRTAGEWTLLGNACWNLIPDLNVAPPGPDRPWDPAQGLLPAQATFAYRRALERDPGQIGALASLDHALRVRRMRDARPAAPLRIDSDRAPAVADGTGPRSGFDPDDPALPAWNDRGDLSRALAGLLDQGRTEASVRLFTRAAGRGIVPDWPAADRVAAAWLHLGRPDRARRVWERAADPPSPAIRLARIATADLAALDHATARRTFRAALELEPDRGEAWFGLALLHTQLGEPAGALAAARRGLKLSLTPAQASFLRGIEGLVATYATGR
jgi:tetratricopeptide (TPR) repeat protein